MSGSLRGDRGGGNRLASLSPNNTPKGASNHNALVHNKNIGGKYFTNNFGLAVNSNISKDSHDTLNISSPMDTNAHKIIK